MKRYHFMKRYYFKFLLTLMFSLLFVMTAGQAWAADGWSIYKQGLAKYEAGQYAQAVTLLEQAANALPPQPAIYNSVAKACEAAGQYQKASEYYTKQGNLCLQRGGSFVQEGYAALRKADELYTTIELYTPGQPANYYTLQKFEPTYGAYIGTFIGDTYRGGYADYEKMTGKEHAVYFDYVNVGDTMANGFIKLDEAVKLGAALHVAYQPMQGLSSVTEAQVRSFAKELRALGCPVFLRYAGEMNGDWVPWNGDPAAYIKSWRMVTNIMREEAPNVAMVWSPSEMPLNQMEAYYPGDEYVDWVGLSVYSKRYANGDINQLMDNRNPLEAVDYVYDLYAAKKPIMISEYGASISVEAGGAIRNTESFAVQKLSYFYQSLKTKYPRVKCIQYFNDGLSSNNRGNRGAVDYCMITGKAPSLLAKYQSIIQDDYFLTDVVNGTGAAAETNPPQRGVIFKGGKVTGDLQIDAWAKTYGQVSSVAYKLNGARVATTYDYPFRMTLSYASLKAGNNTLEAVVFDSKGNVAARQTYTITK